MISDSRGLGRRSNLPCRVRVVTSTRQCGLNQRSFRLILSIRTRTSCRTLRVRRDLTRVAPHPGGAGITCHLTSWARHPARPESHGTSPQRHLTPAPSPLAPPPLRRLTESPGTSPTSPANTSPATSQRVTESPPSESAGTSPASRGTHLSLPARITWHLSTPSRHLSSSHQGRAPRIRPFPAQPLETQ